MRTHSLADLPDVLRNVADILERRNIKRLDRLFWHTIKMRRFGPDVHFAMSREIREPYRVGRCIILHLEPFKTGIVLGWYSKGNYKEHEALMRALSLRDPTDEELDAFDDEKLHGSRFAPGRPLRLRSSASGSGTMGTEPEIRMAHAGSAGVDGVTR